MLSSILSHTYDEAAPPIFLRGENPAVYRGSESDNPLQPRSAANTDIYVASRHHMTYTEAVSPPPKCTISGLRDPDRSRHPLEPLWCLGQQDTSESPIGDRSNGGVAPPSARHADESSTNKYPNPAARCRGKPRRLRRGGGHLEARVKPVGYTSITEVFVEHTPFRLFTKRYITISLCRLLVKTELFLN